MKLFTGSYEGRTVLGVVAKEESKCVFLEDMGMNYESMHEFITKSTPEEYKTLQFVALCVKCDANIANDVVYHELSEVTFLAPIPHPAQDIICLGINYMDHARESAKFRGVAPDEKREFPVYFSKRVNEAIGDGVGIVYNTDAYKELDYEVELAVIIGKDAKNVKKEDVLDYILGYTIVNDVSARDVQNRHKQWYFGKSMEGFAPMGPVITTADEFQGIPDLRVSAKVNGEVRQDSHTALQIFDIAYVIEELSSGFTLKAGTIISTGTPAGVGMGFEPPKFLKVGDVVECEIQGIGTLTTPII